MTKAHFTDQQLEEIKKKGLAKAIEMDVASYPLPPIGTDVSRLWVLGSKGKQYHTDYCAMIVSHMAEGYSIDSFAGAIHTSKQVIEKWAEQFPEFAYALECGKAAQLFAHERIGMAITRTGKGGGDSWRFIMKNQHKWADKVELTGAEGGPIRTIDETKWSDKAEGRLLELMKKANALNVDNKTLDELDKL